MAMTTGNKIVARWFEINQSQRTTEKLEAAIDKALAQARLAGRREMFEKVEREAETVTGALRRIAIHCRQAREPHADVGLCLDCIAEEVAGVLEGTTVAPVAAASGWRHLDEEKPADGEQVLTRMSNYVYRLGDYDAEMDGFVGEAGWYRDELWMSLPAPPVADGERKDGDANGD